MSESVWILGKINESSQTGEVQKFEKLSDILSKQVHSNLTNIQRF